MTNLLLVTSNGTGMGHLTRQAAIALASGPEHEATLFSLSLGLPLAVQLGIAGEYCPSYDRPWIASRDWHAYLRDRLVAIVEETQADVVLFDGVAPYPGIGRAASHLRDVAFAWLRRGMWQPGTNKAQLRKRKRFDLIVEPGDFAVAADTGPTSSLSDAFKVGPISMLEAITPLSGRESRAQLGLPPDGPVALVTLGSGRLGDVAGPGRVVVQTILSHGPEWHVAVTRSPVAQNEIPLDQASRITELRDIYPLAQYLRAFDIAISSAGYNAVHELIPASVPSLFVANTSTRTDDQVARARELERIGVSFWAADNDPKALTRGVQSLLKDPNRETLKEHMSRLPAATGASETAAAITEFVGHFDRRKRTAAELLDARTQWAMEAIGDDRVSVVKRLLGRKPTLVHERIEVRLTNRIVEPEPNEPTPLAIVSAVSQAELRTEIPIEHVLSGASDAYQKRRTELLSGYYEVVA